MKSLSSSFSLSSCRTISRAKSSFDLIATRLIATDQADRCLVRDSKSLLENPEYIRSSWLKSVVNEIIPLTIGVINTKNILTVENLAAAVCYCLPKPKKKQSSSASTVSSNIRAKEESDDGIINSPSSSLNSVKDEDSNKRRIDDSWLEVIMPFSGSLLVVPVFCFVANNQFRRSTIAEFSCQI
jgi:hypothetical protein